MSFALFIWAMITMAQPVSLATAIRWLNSALVSLALFIEQVSPIYELIGSRISSLAWYFSTASRIRSSPKVRLFSSSLMKMSLSPSPPAELNLGTTVSSASSSSAKGSGAPLESKAARESISLLLSSPGLPCSSVTLPKGIYGCHSQRTSFGVISLALMISSFAGMLFG